MPETPSRSTTCGDRGDRARLFWFVQVAVLFAVAAGLRLWRLDRVPGINGDEAWYGVWVMQLLEGQPVSWTTPTGNPLNPFFLLPQAVLHAFAPPSAALLRATAAISGLVALPVNYLLCRRTLGKRTAVFSTVLLAVLPINIAYSRFAWDASQSLLATVLAVHVPLLALRDQGRSARWITLGAIALAAAVWVHPTNIFVAPLLVVAAGHSWGVPVFRFFRARRWCQAALVIAVVAAGWAGRHWIGVAAEQASRPVESLVFARNFARLFSGVTIYRFIPGAPGWSEEGNTFAALDLGVYDLAWLAIFAVAAWGLYRSCRKSGRAEELGLLAGAGLTLAGFYLIAGPRAIAPHWERYGVCLIVPGALVLTAGLARLSSQTAMLRRWLAPTALAVAWTLVACFFSNYFLVFSHSGGESHRTFRTAHVEPKTLALQRILAERGDREEAWIVAGEWWNYWTLKYLASAEKTVRVVQEEPAEEEFRAALGEGRVWFVEFSDSEGCREVRERLRGHLLEEEFIRDAGGRKLLSLLHPLGSTEGAAAGSPESGVLLGQAPGGGPRCSAPCPCHGPLGRSLGGVSRSPTSGVLICGCGGFSLLRRIPRFQPEFLKPPV